MNDQHSKQLNYVTSFKMKDIKGKTHCKKKEQRLKVLITHLETTKKNIKHNRIPTIILTLETSISRILSIALALIIRRFREKTQDLRRAIKLIRQIRKGIKILTLKRERGQWCLSNITSATANQI